MSMHATNVEMLAELLSGTELRAREYSGRFMYGKKCLGIELDQGESSLSLASTLLSEAAHNLEGPSLEEGILILSEMFSDAREDSLGLGTIVYFPKIQWTERLASLVDGQDPDEDSDEED